MDKARQFQLQPRTAPAASEQGDNPLATRPCMVSALYANGCRANDLADGLPPAGASCGFIVFPNATGICKISGCCRLGMALLLTRPHWGRFQKVCFRQKKCRRLPDPLSRTRTITRMSGTGWFVSLFVDLTAQSSFESRRGAWFRLQRVAPYAGLHSPPSGWPELAQPPFARAE
jgi:hypothetical protein